jgi:succinyl-CoA synthetase alpha subunit
VAILLDARSRIIIQGITGNLGTNFATETKRLYPDVLVAGVTPGRGGQTVAGVPVYDAVADAVSRHGADTAFVCVPAPAVRDSVIEARDAGIRLVGVYTEGVPLHEAAQLVAYARAQGGRLLGPNAAGILSPGKAGMGEITEGYFPTRPGRLGIVSKSGSIMYETVALTSEIEGQSTMVCLGGDPLLGTTFIDVLPLFEADPETRAVVLIGEIGGPDELAAAGLLRGMRKPVVAYVCGHAAPPARKMGHAGAIVTGGRDTAAAKSEALRAAGARVARTLPELPDLLRAALASLPG